MLVIGLESLYDLWNAMKLECIYQNQCSGCAWIGRSFAEQKSEKLSVLYTHFKERPSVNWLSAGERGLRDRVDFTWVRGEGLGLYHLSDRCIVDIEKCVMMSPAMQSWYKDFRALSIPIVNKGSLRLRVGLNGLRGVWLDFSNVDVKALLDEKIYLEKLLTMGHVEIGQRRKVLGHKDGQLKLLDPRPLEWFSTFVNNKEVALKCSIADFTQPSMAANKILVQGVLDVLKNKNIKTLIEFGSGIGNFTVPLASVCEKVYALELEPGFVSVLSENLGELEGKVEILRGDYQSPNEKRPLNFDHIDAVLVDPPRSGLKHFLTPLEASSTKPAHFIYISCYPESFAVDKKRLEDMGYTMDSLQVVEQFPQTPHAELIAAFTYKTKKDVDHSGSEC